MGTEVPSGLDATPSLTLSHIPEVVSTTKLARSSGLDGRVWLRAGFSTPKYAWVMKFWWEPLIFCQGFWASLPVALFTLVAAALAKDSLPKRSTNCSAILRETSFTFLSRSRSYSWFQASITRPRTTVMYFDWSSILIHCVGSLMPWVSYK